MVKESNGETRWVYLSHPLDGKTPAYGGGQAFFCENDKSIAGGDSCNQQKWYLSNHSGTHIDCPKHFCEGKTVDFYSAHFWIFQRVYLLDLSSLVIPGYIISWSDISSYLPPVDIEFLLVKTGFSRLRGESVYWRENPGFSPDLAEKLRHFFPDLRLLGFDTISLTSYSDRALGRLAHKAFLDSSKPILLLEDMDLTSVSTNTVFYQVVVSPLVVKGSDASPCTVFARVGDL